MGIKQPYERIFIDLNYTFKQLTGKIIAEPIFAGRYLLNIKFFGKLYHEISNRYGKSVVHFDKIRNDYK